MKFQKNGTCEIKDLVEMAEVFLCETLVLDVSWGASLNGNLLLTIVQKLVVLQESIGNNFNNFLACLSKSRTLASLKLSSVCKHFYHYFYFILKYYLSAVSPVRYIAITDLWYGYKYCGFIDKKQQTPHSWVACNLPPNLKENNLLKQTQKMSITSYMQVAEALEGNNSLHTLSFQVNWTLIEKIIVKPWQLRRARM